MASLDQRKTPFELRGAMAFLGSLPVIFGGKAEIALHPCPAFSHHPQKMDRGRQSSGGGAAELIGNLLAVVVIRRAPR